MPQATGANGRVIMQKETQFNVDPGVPDAVVVPFISCGLRMSRAQDASPTIRSSRNPTRATRGNADVSGALVVEQQAYIARLFEAALGSLTTTGAGPYVHTFKVGQTLPSYLIEKGFADINAYFKYGGCLVNRLSFNVTPSGPQQVTFDVLGAQEAAGGASFDATPADLGKHAFDGLSVGTIEEGGVAIADVTGIDNFTINNDLDPDLYVLGGGGVRADISPGIVQVSGTLKARFKDLTLYTKAINDTKSSLRWIYALGDGGGSAGNESLEFKLAELTFAPNAPVIAGPRGVLVELPFSAFYEADAGASAVQVILKNTQATV